MSTHGRAGGSLENATWAANAAVAAAGRRGEQATARVLDWHARNGKAVMHDLRMPIPGMSLNIDHVVVAGNTVVLVDSKLWRPGFYWTWAGRTFRGLRRARHVDKQTMLMARESIGAYLDRHQLSAGIRCVVAAWPSSDHSPLRLWAAATPGAELINASGLSDWIEKVLPDEPADPAIKAALIALVR